MQKCEPKFNAWLKDKGVGGDDSKKYLLYDKSGRRSLINHAELEAFCRKNFQGASGLIKDFGTSKSAKIESLPSAFILLGGTAPSQAGFDENFVFFFAILLLYAFTAR